MCERAEAASYTVATSWTQPTGPAPWQRVGAHTWRSNDEDGGGGGGGVQQRGSSSSRRDNNHQRRLAGPSHGGDVYWRGRGCGWKDFMPAPTFGLWRFSGAGGGW